MRMAFGTGRVGCEALRMANLTSLRAEPRCTAAVEVAAGALPGRLGLMQWFELCALWLTFSLNPGCADTTRAPHPAAPDVPNRWRPVQSQASRATGASLQVL